MAVLSLQYTRYGVYVFLTRPRSTFREFRSYNVHVSRHLTECLRTVYTRKKEKRKYGKSTKTKGVLSALFGVFAYAYALYGAFDTRFFFLFVLQNRSLKSGEVFSVRFYATVKLARQSIVDQEVGWLIS